MARRHPIPKPETYLKMLMNFYKSKGVVLDEEEFEDLLKHSMVHRYERGLNLINEVKAELQKETKALGRRGVRRLTRKIEDSFAFSTHGPMYYNSAFAAAMDGRPELWYEPKTLYRVGSRTRKK